MKFYIINSIVQAMPLSTSPYSKQEHDMGTNKIKHEHGNKHNGDSNSSNNGKKLM